MDCVGESRRQQACVCVRERERERVVCIGVNFKGGKTEGVCVCGSV